MLKLKLKRKIFQITFVLLLLLFSFFYTNKTIDVIKQADPIMKQVKENSEKYQIKAQDAKVKDNKITPGRNGKEIDYDKTYTKMKRYGAYNESLTVFKETKPTVSIEEVYDKYVVSGNQEKKEVALVFKIEKTTNITEIANILNQENSKATFFIDGLWLENNLETVKNLETHELEILNYDNKYQEVYFSSALNYLSNITGKEPKYCYADYDSKEIIELCSKLKLHTVVPTIKVGNSPYKEIKNKLENAAIISLPVNTTTSLELKTVLDYMKSKGYNIVTLDVLLSESIEK